MERDGLFIDDLPESLSRLGVARAAESSPEATTQALGEEGEQPEDVVVTSQAVGEEGDQVDDVVATTQALGEEGEQPDDQPVESEWGSWTEESDLFLDESVDDHDDDVPFDAAL